MTAIAYLTDTEGIWPKLVTFLDQNPLLSLDQDGRLWVAPGAVFVFGGDAIDRGPDARRLVKAFLDLKQRQPEQAIFLAGNRDINKLRLFRELAGLPPRRTPPEVASGPRPDLLRWIFANTMGAKDAFLFRQQELSRHGVVADEDVVQSFLDDLAVGGSLLRYLSQCQLTYRSGETFFVHGGVTEENLGVLPGASGAPLTSVELWATRLNEWYASQVEAYTQKSYTESGEPSWQPLIAYQSPLPGLRVNQTSVVYSRLTDDLGNPHLPSPKVRQALQREGIRRLVLGHTPSGDSPSVMRAPGFELIMADNSYGRVDFGSRVILDGERTEITASAKLDGGDGVTISYSLDLSRDNQPIGMRLKDSGHLVKGCLADGSYLLFKALDGYKIEQVVISARDLAHRELLMPEAEGTPYL